MSSGVDLRLELLVDEIQDVEPSNEGARIAGVGVSAFRLDGRDEVVQDVGADLEG